MKVKQKVKLNDTETLEVTFRIEIQMIFSNSSSIPVHPKKLTRSFVTNGGVTILTSKKLREKIEYEINAPLTKKWLGKIQSRKDLIENNLRESFQENSKKGLGKIVNKWGIDILNLKPTIKINDTNQKDIIKRAEDKLFANIKIKGIENVDVKNMANEATNQMENKIIRDLRHDGKIQEQAQKNELDQREKQHKRKEKYLDNKIENDSFIELVDKVGRELAIEYISNQKGKPAKKSFNIGPDMEKRLESGLHNSKEIDAVINAMEDELDGKMSNNDSAHYWAALGTLYKFRNNRSEAIRYLNKSINLSDMIKIDNPIARNQLLGILWSDGANDLYDYPENYSSKYLLDAVKIKDILKRLIETNDLEKNELWRNKHEKILRFLAKDEKYGEEYKENLKYYE